ncbi:MAG: 3'-5' exonuclease domain-containing protein 2 [Paenibacillus sp.]|nr:3'-5' exonuclease domain-containing protein 2 [Paenibacillus sp.]
MDNQSFSIAIDKRKVAEMPIVTFSGAITVVEQPGDAAEAVRYLRGQSIVGFDTETKPNFRKGMTNRVSLIQVATEQHSFLFRINKMGFTPELKEFMECDDIVKIGLSLKDDFHMLHMIGEFEPHNFVELQEMVKKYHITDSSLQKIYAILFNQRISKGQRLTNWEATKLTGPQMIYASIDAWACLKIYRYLNSGQFDPSTSPYIVPDTPEATPPVDQQ